MRSRGYLQGKTGEQTEQRGGRRQDPEEAATEEPLHQEQEQLWIKKFHTEKQQVPKQPGGNAQSTGRNYVGRLPGTLVAGIGHV